MTNPPPDISSPYSGEFLLQLLHHGRNPGTTGGHGTANCIGDSRWSSSSDDACQSSSSNHSSSSFSRGSSLDATTSFTAGDENLAFAFVDPAVAALGPSHPLSGSSRLEAPGNLQLQQHHDHHHHHHRQLYEHPRGWSAPQHPSPDASSSLPINQHDLMMGCVPDHVLPSPMDPLFRPTFNQTFKNASDCFQGPAHPYPQYSGSPAPVDYNAYVRHSPPFCPPPGFPNTQISHDPWFNNAVSLHRKPADMERALPGLTRQSPAVLPYAGSSIAAATDQVKGNNAALSSLTASHLEHISQLNEESDVGLSLPKHYGPIGPLKRRVEPGSWGMSASVETGWSFPDQSFQLHPAGASEILTKQVDDCKISGNVLEQLFIDVAKGQLNSSTPGLTECVELVSKGSAAQASKESVLQTADWIGWTDLMDGHSSGVLRSQQKENFENGPQAGRAAKVSEEESIHLIVPHNKASYRKLTGPQGADAPGKSLLMDVSRRRVAGRQEKTVDSMIKSGSFDFGSSEAQGKSNLSFMEPGMVSQSQENQKVHDDIKKKRGQVQEWRLKQPALLHRKSTVLGSKSKEPANETDVRNNFLRLQEGQGHLGPPSGVNLNSAPSSAIEQSKQALHTFPSAENIDMAHVAPVLNATKEDRLDDATILGCVSFLELDNGKEAKEVRHLSNGTKPSQASEELKSSELVQHKHTFDWPTRFQRRDLPQRDDLDKCNGQLLSIFQKLIPSEDEELRRKQLLSSLDELVIKIWPEARLYLFGSCANAFGVCNSDIDVCLSVDGETSSKSELVLRLADTLKANKMQNVQALTHARVPIVKYSDPTTGISCDVCINNMLAVVNTKLLHDYAQIDVRLRQLAFIVKHWAKCRQVNETYRGTLSSYAYVLMCIHFLQQRRPPVLPCLQEMKPTYEVTVGDISCAYYDHVAKLHNFGSKNKETLGELLMAFFDYWAFKHDYSHAVISIRTGSFLSKVEKDWTRRIGNERHLICIEDPFETTHDLGRVVDKHSIRVLREEFQRAAKIMRHHANPCAALFKWE